MVLGPFLSCLPSLCMEHLCSVRNQCDFEILQSKAIIATENANYEAAHQNIPVGGSSIS